MNLKRKPPTARKSLFLRKKNRASDEKSAANTLLMLSHSSSDFGKTNDEIIVAETLLSFVNVCTEEEFNATDITPGNEMEVDGDCKNEQSTVRSTQVIAYAHFIC